MGKLQGGDDRDVVDRGGEGIVGHLLWHRCRNRLVVEILGIDRDSCFARSKLSSRKFGGKKPTEYQRVVSPIN